jgi:hypothetical protein
MAVLGSDNITHSTDFKFNINSSDRVLIDSSGRLLVGTSTSRSVGAERSLQVEGTSGGAGAISIVRNSNDTGPSSLNLGKSRGTTNGSSTIVSSGDLLGSIAFLGADGNNLNVDGSRIEAGVDGTPGTNDMPARLSFLTRSLGSGAPSERLRITSGGTLLFGGTLPSAPVVTLDNVGRIKGTLFHTGQYDYNGGGTQTFLTAVRGATYLLISQLVNYSVPAGDTRHGILAFAARTAYGVDVTTVTQIGAATGSGSFSVSGADVRYNGGGGNPQCFITWMQISRQY